MNSKTLELNPLASKGYHREEIFREIDGLLKQGLAAGDLFTHEQVAAQMEVFRGRFGARVLQGLDGASLLDTMHGRAGGEKRCLAYWLEFKDDAEFQEI